MREMGGETVLGIRLRFSKKGSGAYGIPPPWGNGGAAVRVSSGPSMGPKFLGDGTLSCQDGTRSGRWDPSCRWCGLPVGGLCALVATLNGVWWVLRTVRAWGDTFPAILMPLEDWLAHFVAL